MTAAVAAGSRRAPGASSCSPSTLVPVLDTSQDCPCSPSRPPLRPGCPRSVYRRLMGCGMALLERLRESPGRAALSLPWTELRDSGVPTRLGVLHPSSVSRGF